MWAVDGVLNRTDPVSVPCYNHVSWVPVWLGLVSSQTQSISNRSMEVLSRNSNPRTQRVAWGPGKGLEEVSRPGMIAPAPLVMNIPRL